MTTLLRLTPISISCIQAQVCLNGTFHHTLIGIDGKTTLRAAVSIEQYDRAIEVTFQSEGLRHSTSITLDRHRRDKASRVIHFVEQLANGDPLSGVPEASEYLLICEMESILRRAIRMGRGTWHLIADDLEPCLLITRTPYGYAVRIELDQAQCHLTLPADSQRAYRILSESLKQFLQGYRDSLAAAA